MSEITDLSASQLLSLYQDRQLSPVEVSRFAQIQNYKFKIQAFIHPRLKSWA